MTTQTAAKYTDDELLSTEIKMAPEMFHFVKKEWHMYFDRANHKWVRVNESGKAIITSLHASGSIKKTVDEIVTQYNLPHIEVQKAILDFTRSMLDAKFFQLGTFISKEVLYSYDENVRPKIVFYANTELCNLKCTYCYNEEERDTYQDYKQQMSTEQALWAMEELARFGTKAVAFCGGEPMVRKDTMSVARYVRKLGMSPVLITNATLITEENVAEIAELYDLVWISLDSMNKEEHELTRGAGSFEPTWKAVHMLAEYKRKHNKPNSYIVNSVVTLKNYATMPAMKKYLEGELGITQHRAVFYDNMYSEKKGYESEDVIGSILNKPKLLRELEVNEVSIAHCGNEIPTLHLDKHDKIAIQDATRKFHCGMGAGDIYLSSNGDLYPCQLLYHKEFLAGNVFVEGLEQAYLKSSIMTNCRDTTVDKIEVCKDCTVKYVCGGGCRAIAWGRTGDLAGHDKHACGMLKKSAISGMWKDTMIPTERFQETQERFHEGLEQIFSMEKEENKYYFTEQHEKDLREMKAQILQEKDIVVPKTSKCATAAAGMEV